jgi:hypothetical protein
MFAQLSSVQSTPKKRKKRGIKVLTCRSLLHVYSTVTSLGVHDRNSVRSSPRVPTINTDPLPWVMARDRPGGAMSMLCVCPSSTGTTTPGVIRRIHHDRPWRVLPLSVSLFSVIRYVSIWMNCEDKRGVFHVTIGATRYVPPPSDESTDNRYIPQARVRRDVAFKRSMMESPPGHASNFSPHNARAHQHQKGRPNDTFQIRTI